MTILNTAMAIELGVSSASKVYVGSTQVWPSASVAPALVGVSGKFDAFLADPPNSIPLPTVANGDLRIVVSNGTNQSSTVNNPPAVSGWSVIDALHSGSDMTLYSRVKQPGDSDANLSINLSDGSGGSQWLGAVWSLGFTGGDPSSVQFDHAQVSAGAGSQTSLIFSTFTAVADSAVFMIYTQQSNLGTPTVTGWTELLDSGTFSSLNWAKWKVLQLDGDLASGASVTPTVVIGASVSAPAGWIVAIPTT